MFKKKKNKITYDINLYKTNEKYFEYAYDVHLNGALIATSSHSTVEIARWAAENVCKEHVKLGKYKYTV